MKGVCNTTTIHIIVIQSGAELLDLLILQIRDMELLGMQQRVPVLRCQRVFIDNFTPP